MRVVEHAPRGPHQFLERIHGLAEIVKRGLVVFVVVTGAASSISRLASSLRRDTTVVATAARAPTASATRSSASSSPRARLSTATAHTGSEASCASFDRFVRARRGCNPQNPLAVLPCFWATRPPFAHARGNDPLRMAAARASSSFQTSRQQLSWLNSLFVVTEQ